MILTIDILSKCNLKCCYCYQKQKGTIHPKKINELVGFYKPRVLNIGGGEPFLHNGLAKIVNDNINKIDELNIATNATMIKDYSLLKHPKLVVQVSLPSLARKTYKKITGKDSLKEVLATIDELLGNNVNTTLNSAIVKYNLNEVENLLAYAMKKKIPICINPAHPTGSKQEWLLTNEGLINLRDILFLQKMTNNKLESILVNPLDCSSLKREYGFFSPCKVKNKVYISPNLQTHKCEFLQGGIENGQ